MILKDLIQRKKYVFNWYLIPRLTVNKNRFYSKKHIFYNFIIYNNSTFIYILTTASVPLSVRPHLTVFYGNY